MSWAVLDWSHSLQKPREQQKVSRHWQEDEQSPARGEEVEPPKSFAAGAVTLALFSAGKRVVLKAEGLF